MSIYFPEEYYIIIVFQPSLASLYFPIVKKKRPEALWNFNVTSEFLHLILGNTKYSRVAKILIIILKKFLLNCLYVHYLYVLVLIILITLTNYCVWNRKHVQRVIIIIKLTKLSLDDRVYDSGCDLLSCISYEWRSTRASLIPSRRLVKCRKSAGGASSRGRWKYSVKSMH